MRPLTTDKELLIESVATLRWYMAGPVIDWSQAAPAVKERYREKARTIVAEEIVAGNLTPAPSTKDGRA